MAATRYDVADLKTALTAIHQKFDQAPREVVGALHVNNLNTELAATLKFLKEAPPSAKDKKTLKDEPQIVKGFREWADALVWEDLGPRKPNPRFICTTLWYCRTLEHRARWTKSPDGFLLYLSLLPAVQPKAFEWDSANFPVAQWQPNGHSRKKEPLEQASYYLDLLNAEFNDREPEEYYKECLWTEMRNVAVPDYNDATHQWYTYANRHWSALRPQIFTLFNSSNKFNFVQWALEWARDGEPRLFKSTTGIPNSSSAEATINLTNDLCTGALSPLHVAAMLGLPSLCEDLSAAGMDHLRVWKGRMPLHSALEGDTSCFWDYVGADGAPSDVRKKARPFKYEFNRYSPKYRADTIHTLLEALPLYELPMGLDEVRRGAMELAPLALWAAYKLRAPEIFEKTLDRRVAITTTFLKMLIEEDLSPERPGDKELLSRLFTYLHGHCLVTSAYVDPLGISLPLIKDGMDYHALGWHMVDGTCPLPQASAPNLRLLAEQSIFAESVFDLGRICLDPRFDPNPVPGEFGHGSESLLHQAVGAGLSEMVDALMKAGADLTVVDENNRTPLMNCETPKMIEKLVREYAAPTECQDNEGRTVWHAAAFNNDLAALSALNKFDPWNKNNMVRKSDEGRTPLAEAMAHVQRLRDVKFTGQRFSPFQPVSARFLLKLAREHGDDQCLASPVPLSHLAAAWGELDMIEDLEALGVDWSQLDDENRTPLHCLSLSASPDVVRRLKELCHGANLDKYHHNVLESVILNSIPRGPEGHFSFRELSHHPSCHGQINKESALELCKPEIFRREGPKGLHPWESFCRTVFPLPHSGEVLTRIITHLFDTVNCLIEEGVLADYEQREGRPAALLLLDRDKGLEWRKQHPKGVNEGDSYDTYLAAIVLRKSNRELCEKFAKSDEGVNLLNIAIRDNSVELTRALCDLGTRVFVHSPEQEAVNSPLITAIEWEARAHDRGPEHGSAPFAMCQILCDHADPEELKKGRILVLKTFWSVIQERNPPNLYSMDAERLKGLILRGMDIHGIRGDHADCQFLDEVASKRGDKGLCQFLRNQGAELKGPCEVCASAGDRTTDV